MRVERLDGERIFVLHRFLEPRECEAMIARAERAGFEEAPINAGGGEAVMVKSVRNNARVIVDDESLAASLFARARPHLPQVVESRGLRWELAGLNERFRFYRYDPDERFAPHSDGSYRRPDGETSLLTFLVFLNERCAGGATRFYRRSGLSTATVAFEVKPETGKALVFNHEELHEGAPVEAGRKYVLRSDVMYRLAAGGYAGTGS